MRNSRFTSSSSITPATACANWFAAVAWRELVPVAEVDAVEELGDDLVLLAQPCDGDRDRDGDVLDVALAL